MKSIAGILGLRASQEPAHQDRADDARRAQAAAAWDGGQRRQFEALVQGLFEEAIADGTLRDMNPHLAALAIELAGKVEQEIQ